MSYARRQPMRASRTLAIAVVALTQASLGYALVTGLAYTVVQQAPAGLKTFNVEEVQPPPPEPRPAPKRAPDKQPRVVAPPPVRTNAPLPGGRPTVLQDLPPLVMPAPPASAYQPRSEPSPPPVTEAVAPRSATGDLQSVFRSEDYPAAAIERLEQGSVIVQLTVNVTGRVAACYVASSSGSRTLDNASCRILRSRALFTPARDSSGNLTTDTVREEIRWVLR